MPVLTVVTNVEDAPAEPVDGGSLIDEIVRDGARRMLAAALEAEVAGYIAAHAGEVDEHGHVDDTSGQRRRFASVILPAWCRKSPKVTDVLPLLYLHGLSSKDFVPALEGFLGTGAGLSAATVTRLTVQWQDETRAFNARDLSKVDYVYLWADGIHVNIRLDEEKLCLLVLVGVRVDKVQWLHAELLKTRLAHGFCARPKAAGPCVGEGDEFTGRRSRRDLARKPPGSPWRSSSSKPRRYAGVPSTAPTSSRSPAPAPSSRTASSSSEQPEALKPRRHRKDLHSQVLTIAPRRRSHLICRNDWRDRRHWAAPAHPSVWRVDSNSVNMYG
jgi:Transposase, Mutator family